MKAYISKKANNNLRKYLDDLGYTPVSVATEGIVYDAVSCHPDIFMCKLGAGDDAPIVFAEEKEIGYEYPGDIAFNAACTGKYFIHNLKYTNPRLLKKARELGMTLVNVRQGYSKCSIVIIDEKSIITYDKGIAKSCAQYEDLAVLLVEPGHCVLESFDTGFLGGCSGRACNKVIFNGNLESHPDFEKIKAFIESRGLECVWFSEFKLTDIGSIIIEQ
ncbi:MAG: hypothetical protein Q4E84_05365 [Clostridia bacterium]|nr:hypothetical protein [Clostridia bacterium]